MTPGYLHGVQQPNMRFVPKKTLQQQNIQALHRARSAWSIIEPR